MIRTSLCLDPSLKSRSLQRAAAERLLRHNLRRAFGLAGPETTLVRDGFGRPVLVAHPSVQVSISHCEGAVLVASSNRPIGVDVEDVRPHDRYAAARMLRPAELVRVAEADDPEREFFRYWTLKESYAKAIGIGIGYPMLRLAVRVSADGSAALNRPGAAVALDERYERYVVAVCCLRGDPQEVGVVTEQVDLARL